MADMADSPGVGTAKHVNNDEYDQMWDIFTQVLSGESMNLDESFVNEYFPVYESSLLEQLIEELRINFYDGQLFEFNNYNDLASFFGRVRSFKSQFLNTINQLPFGDHSHDTVDREIEGLIRSSIDTERFANLLEEYLIDIFFNRRDVSEVRDIMNLGFGPEIRYSLGHVSRKEISKHIKSNYCGKWTESVHDHALAWVSNYIGTIVQQIIGEDVGDLSSQLEIIVNKELAELRINELFDMTLAYPKSRPGLEDLKHTMSTPELRSKAISSFQSSCRTRLLNNGIATIDVFLTYLSTIQVFSFLDPRGLQLEVVSKQIHRYLKERPDAVEIFIDGLMGEKDSRLSFLADELSQQTKSKLSTIDDDLTDVSWVPDPVDAPPDFVKRKMDDTISTLLSLHDNKEVFIKRLTTVFSEKLLAHDTEAELEQIKSRAEPLKQRFGQRQLQQIDVMISDVAKSHELNMVIHESNSDLTPVHALIVSKLYWPSLNPQNLNIPDKMRSLLENYGDQYKAVRQKRKLSWLPNKGRISITVDLQDRSIQLVVTPEQLSVLHAFEDQGAGNSGRILSVSELVAETSMSEQAVLSALSYLMHQGVVGTENDSYMILETESEAERLAKAAPHNDLARQARDQTTEMMKFWSYIVGMLTNLGTMPSERIHSFLVMLVPKEDPYLKSQQELESFLHQMVEDDRLKFSEGKFSLP